MKSARALPFYWLVFKNEDDLSVIIQRAGDIIMARLRALFADIAGEVSGRPRAGC